MSSIRFWRQFASHSDDWSSAMLAGDCMQVFQSIDHLLMSHGLDLCFDITMDEDKCVLIFSPEGDVEDARRIDDLLTLAPASGSWMFFGRRLQKSLDDVSAILRNLYSVNLFDLRFRVRTSGTSEVVEIVAPSSIELSPDEARGFANSLLWHAIGERRVMDHNIKGRVVIEDQSPEPTVSPEQLLAHFDRGSDRRL